jgi:crotonobetainyl-CoA:carnitine CoA-transferase CaiB-like acyl-CoA transferase
VVKRLGVEYETLSAANPALVYCSISGYGQTGPMRDAAGHDVNYLSYAGVLGLSGRPEEPPSLLPVQVGDVYGGSMMALSGILMALLSRQRTGKGAWLDISMTDGSVASLAIPASNFLGGGVPQERGALPLAGLLPCYDTYRCADGGYVSLGALEPWFWQKLVSRLGRGDFGELQYAMGEAAEGVRRDLQAIFLGKTRDEWIRLFEGEDVCISPVLSIDEALSHPNVLARRMVVDVDSPLGGTERQLGLPIKIAGEETRAPGRAPRLGEHDDPVLAELGYSGEEIAGLRAKGVVRKRGTS